MNKNLLIPILIVALFVLACTTWHYSQKSEEEMRKRKAAEQANIRLIMDSVRRQKGFTEAVKAELDLLAEKFKDVEPDVTAKLAKAIQLIDINQTENAIEDLAVIMENLLLQYYEKDNGFVSWLKKGKATLHNLLMYCKEDNKISEVEFQFYLAIKTIRNKEDHTLNQRLDNYLNASGLIVGIGAIAKIAGFWHEKKQKDALSISA